MEYKERRTDMAVFGKNILENLTTGMYSDRRVMYREYVQNACDAIDSAIKKGILKRDDARIDITIKNEEHYIEISDNGSGIPSNDFKRVLSDIANSDKIRSEDKGFRGIGRLCGLAYCAQLQFISKTKGDSEANIMTWDAKKMRAMLNDSKKRRADEVLSEILNVSSEPEDKESHYFKVVMKDISSESKALLDSDKICDYLAFEAPVPYDSHFMFTGQIIDYAKELGVKIDEYPIYIDNEQIFKKYRTRIYTNGKVHDEIKAIRFENFYDENDNLMAWMWYGLSSLNGQIKSENIQRGLRLRKGNIQIGTSRVFREQGLFPDGRANEYFIGEIHAIHADLIPNARRDYFNENSIRSTFEESLKKFFIVLWKLCNVASDDRSAIKSIQTYYSAIENYQEKKKTGFAGGVEREALDIELERKKSLAENAKQKLSRPVSTEAMDEETATLVKEVKEIVRKVEDKEKIAFKKDIPPLPFVDKDNDSDTRKSKPRFITDDLSKLSRETRKVVSRIYDIINQTIPDKAEELIAKIQTALKQAN
jgi:molecular chaperone HtpG